MQAQYVGTMVRIANVFTDSGVPLDPTTVTFALKIPDDPVVVSYVYGVDPEIIRESAGVYRVDYVPLVPKTFVFTWTGTGAVEAVELGLFEVLPAQSAAIRVPGYMTSADLDARVGAAKIDELFSDDGSGIRDSVTVNTLLIEAEDFAATRMLKSWGIDQVNDMASLDESFRAQVAWVAIELASERRSEFLAEDGKGRYWAQYTRAKEHFDALAKSKIASAAETTVGKSKQTGGGLNPPVQQPVPRFTWASDKYNPYGRGGF